MMKCSSMISKYLSDYNPVINKQKDRTLKKNGRYDRNVLCKKGFIPPKDLTAHQSLSLKSNGSNNTTGLKTLNGSTWYQQNILIRTPQPAHPCLPLANTHSTKSLSLHNNERSLTDGVLTIPTTTTIHQCDQDLLGNNGNDEEEDRLSTTNELEKKFRPPENPSEMPMLTERLNVLHETGSILLKEYGGHFARCIEQSGGNAVDLLE